MTETTWGARDEAARELERRVGLRAERDALLAEHTTMRVGGPADLLITVRDRFTLRGVVRLAQSKGWPLRILGRGSNVVVSDAGIRGIVLLNRSAGVTIDAGAGTINADSGLSMAKLSTLAADAGLTVSNLLWRFQEISGVQSGPTRVRMAVRCHRSSSGWRSCGKTEVKRRSLLMPSIFRIGTHDSKRRLGVER